MPARGYLKSRQLLGASPMTGAGALQVAQDAFFNTQRELLVTLAAR